MYLKFVVLFSVLCVDNEFEYISAFDREYHLTLCLFLQWMAMVHCKTRLPGHPRIF